MACVCLLVAVGWARADDDFSSVESLVESGGGNEWMDPRFLILPIGAGNLLNINTTAALLALLGSAALLSALGYLIYAIVSSKLKSAYGGSGGGGYGSGGGSYYSSGGSGGYGGYGSTGGSYGYARSSDRVDWDSLKVLDYISMMEEMWRKFDVKEMACQKRVLCELHQNEAALGPAATKIVNMFGYLRYLSLLSLPAEVKAMMEDYLDAADKGRTLRDQTCGQVFDGCQFSIKETFLKYLPSAADVDTPDDNHLPE